MLELHKAKERIKSPGKKAEIAKAIRQQERIKFHADCQIDRKEIAPARDFKTWVSGLIPHDKYKTFLKLFAYPVQTNDLTGSIFDELRRVFDGRNPVFNYQFADNRDRDDWEYYRTEVIGEPEIWETEGFERMKSDINSVLIVDLPAEKKPGEYPAPYFYWLSICDVIDYETVKGDRSQMDWIMFRQPEDRIAIFDDVSYRLFESKSGGLGALISEHPHGLGYCPARFFWTTPVNLENPDVKMSPLSKALNNLNWYLFFAISKRHLDLYAPYPIYSGYSQDCSYHNDDSGDYCDGGFIRNRKEHDSWVLTADGTPMACPICTEKRLSGPGTFVEVDPPKRKEDADLRNPVQITTIDRSSLDYNVEEVRRLYDEIFKSCVGTDDEPINDQAVNEKQVAATFESKTTKLNWIKRNFEAAQLFVDTTMARLRYGQYFVEASIDLGTDFYIATAESLRKQYESAKASGASEAELDALSRRIIETEYRNDRTELARMLILLDLEPYRHFTRDEVFRLAEKGLISDDDLRIKLNFSTFVARFERENTNVMEFGSAIPYDRKIKIINEKLREYGKESV